MRKLRPKVSRIVNFEDRGEGVVYADCVINALYPESGNHKIYGGFRYFFIRDEFLTAVPKKFSQEVFRKAMSILELLVYGVYGWGS